MEIIGILKHSHTLGTLTLENLGSYWASGALKFNYLKLKYFNSIWFFGLNFQFFQFNLNILFEFAIFFNSIWMSCLNCQFLSIQFEYFVWIVNFYQFNLNILFELSIFNNSNIEFKLSTQFFFQTDFFKNWRSNPIQTKLNWIELKSIWPISNYLSSPTVNPLAGRISVSAQEKFYKQQF